MFTKPETPKIDRSLGPDCDPRPRALVIGAGFGGLAAAIRLGARGYRVTVLERLDQPGGRARVYHQDGYSFDAGPTIVTAPYLFEELWRLAGRRLEDDVTLKLMDPFYRIRFDDGTVFDACGDEERMRAQIRALSPEDEAGYDRYLAASRRAFEIGFQGMGQEPFNTLPSMLRRLPDVLRLHGHHSVHWLVAKHFKHPKLRVVFSFHPLLIGGNPFAVTSIYSLISHLEKQWGVWSAVGGTGALVRGMVGLIEGQGGEVRLGTDVAEITTEARRATGVRLASGEEITAPVTVCNADVLWTYENLLPGRKSLGAWRNLVPPQHSMGLYVWYFGTDRQWPDVAHHSILLGPRYKELLRDIFRRKRLADDFSLYLHRPTATDPALAPDGGDAFYALCPVPHLGSGTDWATEGPKRRDAIVKRLEETVLPGLSRHIVTERAMDPTHFRDELNAIQGAGFGPEPLLLQSAWFRAHNSSEEVDGLWMVGAGTHPGAGLPGVLTSAQIVDDLIPDAEMAGG
ncbi:MAG: phytoene desaturase family protein [Pseudomonadota bacterium]